MITKLLIGVVRSDDQSCSITGTLSAEQSLTGQIVEHSDLTGSLASIGSLTGRLTSAYTTHMEAYEGSYEAVPKTVAQTLDTKEKYMNDNVSITSIPYFDVSNNTGGSTVYIGTEIEVI